MSPKIVSLIWLFVNSKSDTTVVMNLNRFPRPHTHKYWYHWNNWSVFEKKKKTRQNKNEYEWKTSALRRHCSIWWPNCIIIWFRSRNSVRLLRCNVCAILCTQCTLYTQDSSKLCGAQTAFSMNRPEGARARAHLTWLIAASDRF